MEAPSSKSWIAVLLLPLLAAMMAGGDTTCHHPGENCITICANGTFIRNCTLDTTPAGYNSSIRVTSRDVFLDTMTGVAARIFLPKIDTTHAVRMPVVIYMHGGGFVKGSATDSLHNSFVSYLAHKSSSIFVSVDYRLAPENSCEAIYDDSWSAVEYALSGKDRWILQHGNTSSLFLAGESAGANIAHNLLLRAAAKGTPKVLGGILLNPMFFGEDLAYSEKADSKSWQRIYWHLMCPSLKVGLDDYRLNPLAPGAPSLKYLPHRMFVAVSGEDAFSARGSQYALGLVQAGASVTLIQSKGQPHAFFVADMVSPMGQEVIVGVAKFITFSVA